MFKGTSSVSSLVTSDHLQGDAIAGLEIKPARSQVLLRRYSAVEEEHAVQRFRSIEDRCS